MVGSFDGEADLKPSMMPADEVGDVSKPGLGEGGHGE